MLEIPFIGICPGTDEKNPSITDPGYPRVPVGSSGVDLKNFGCNHLVNGTKCKAGIPEDEILPHKLPDCEILLYLSSHSPKEILPDTLILDIRTNKGQLIYDSQHFEIQVSPFLPEGHEPVGLSIGEGRFLEALMRAQGRVLTPEQLGNAMHPDEAYDMRTRTVQMTKMRVSTALGEISKTEKKVIEPIRGIGYTIRKPSHYRQ